MKTLIKSVLIVAFIAAITVYGGLSWQRFRTIQSLSEKAQEENQGSRIDALCAYLNASDVSLEEKNQVIWVLGELRDPNAIPTLNSLATSEVCDHKQYVCQTEVQKAIRKIRGDIPNPFFWQKIDNE